ncbi:MAG TPA: phage holin family protein [Sulfuricella sp.]|nr:phage holin family protein [Sulfuricella sp.]
MLASLRIFAATTVAIAQTRLELLANEIEEEKLRFGQLLVFGGIALFCIAVGIVFFAIFITVLLWDNHRLLVLGGFSVLFLGVGVVAIQLFRGHASAGSKLFSTSLAELGKDRQQLLP